MRYFDNIFAGMNNDMMMYLFFPPISVTAIYFASIFNFWAKRCNLFLKLAKCFFASSPATGLSYVNVQYKSFSLKFCRSNNLNKLVAYLIFLFSCCSDVVLILLFLSLFLTGNLLVLVISKI